MNLLSEISLRIRVIKYRLGLRLTLPADAINRVKISDSGEPMINIKNCTTLFFAPDLIVRDKICVRQGVYNRLLDVAKHLPPEYGLKIMSAHRTISEQTDLWNRKMAETKAKHPNASDTELIAINRRLVAQPHHGFGGHQTGGAVDVTLCDKNGNDIGLGKWLCDTPNIAPKKQKKLRHVLKHAMCSAGFVNYPAEWWHFCYGDRMWAAYKKRSKCCYGLVE